MEDLILQDPAPHQEIPTKNLKGIDVDGIYDFLEGFINGIGEHENPQLKTCMGHVEFFADKINNIIEELKNEDYDDLVRSVLETEDIISKLLDAVKNCKIPEATMKKLEDFVAELEDPWSFMWNLGGKIYYNFDEI